MSTTTSPTGTSSSSPALLGAVVALRTLPFHAEAAAVDQAAERSVALLRQYASLPETSEVWQHPERILEELNDARTRLWDAWMALQGAMEEYQALCESVETPAVPEQDVRAAYIDMITDAFADVLEEMREKETDLDIEILADCLQSGLELMTQDDRDLFRECWAARETQDEDEEAQGLTPHERRRRQLGYSSS